MDYEQDFIALWEELGEQVAQVNLVNQGKDNRKKN